MVTATPTTGTAYPRKMVSTMLYSVLNTIMMMAGMENSNSSFPTGAEPRRSGSVASFLSLPLLFLNMLLLAMRKKEDPKGLRGSLHSVAVDGKRAKA